MCNGPWHASARGTPQAFHVRDDCTRIPLLQHVFEATHTRFTRRALENGLHQIVVGMVPGVRRVIEGRGAYMPAVVQRLVAVILADAAQSVTFLAMCLIEFFSAQFRGRVRAAISRVVCPARTSVAARQQTVNYSRTCSPN